MKNYLYIIWDEAAKLSSPTFEAANDVVAWRNFDQGNKDNPYRHEAYLYRIAEIDKTTFSITNNEPKAIILPPNEPEGVEE